MAPRPPAWLGVGLFTLAVFATLAVFNVTVEEFAASWRGSNDPGGTWQGRLPVLMATAAILLCLIWLSLRLGRFNTASIAPAAKDRVRRILITGISYPGDNVPDLPTKPRSLKALEDALKDRRNGDIGSSGQGVLAVRRAQREGINRFDALTLPYVELKTRWRDGEPDELFEKNPYLQTLRAIRPHWEFGDKLLVVLLPSTQSVDQVQRMAEVICKVFDGKSSRLRVAWYDNGREPGRAADYEDYNAVYRALSHIIKKLKDPDHLPPVIAPELSDKAPVRIFPSLGWWAHLTRDASGEVCIDVTPGQKIFSIAAAVATLNSRAIFSYVASREAGPDQEGVMFFDAHCEVVDLRGRI